MNFRLANRCKWEPRGTTPTAVDENREGCRENGKQAIQGTSRREQQSHIAWPAFSQENPSGGGHTKLYAPRITTTHSKADASRQWNSMHSTWNDGGSRYGCRPGDGRPHRHGGWRKSTPNRPTATESGPETHYKNSTPTKVTVPTNAGTGPLLLRVIPASDHKA